MSTTTITIEGMHCDGCAERVKRVLEREAGVRTAAVSYAGGQAEVEYDERVTAADRLEQVVERAGYTARAGG